MASFITRRAFVAAAGAAGLGVLAGCSSNGAPSSGTSEATSLPSLTVGTLATEDILPLWVAQEQGWLEEFGLNVGLVEFQSATELIAGVGSGDVDLAMTDIMVAASLFANGIDVQMEWITLGATPEQGRFGIMVGPDSTVEDLGQLAGVPIAVGSNTILEYVMDRLMENAEVPSDQIVVEEIQKLPVRYQAMVSGEVAAAALPASLLALGEASGCRTIADDTTGENLSQSVMIARTDALQEPGFSDAVDALKKAWNETVAGINEDPQGFQEVLVQKANLSEVVAQTYPVSDYPVCQLPTDAMVDPVLAWMSEKGYLKQPLDYDQQTGRFNFA